MNIAILTGNLGKDPQENSNNGMMVYSFTLGTTDNMKKDGKWESQTEWHNITCFGKLAEIVSKFRKGDKVEVTGKIKHSNYKNKEGQTVYKTEIIAGSATRIKKADSDSNKQREYRQPVNDTQNVSPQELEPQVGNLPF